jgi:tetratricopeptide (TPR) repeat protein
LQLAKAQIALGQGAAAGATLQQAETLAAALPTGQRARTLFSAGLFWRELGFKPQAMADLQKAVALQPDDWVDLGAGRREKSAGLAGYYLKMLAATAQDR